MSYEYVYLVFKQDIESFIVTLFDGAFSSLGTALRYVRKKYGVTLNKGEISRGLIRPEFYDKYNRVYIQKVKLTKEVK